MTWKDDIKWVVKDLEKEGHSLFEGIILAFASRD
jgi:hypothetical protein